MKHILIINGPNLNLLGEREPEIYGNRTFEDYFQELVHQFHGKCVLHYYQSNVEGELINKLHEARHMVQGIIINAGGYTHTSVAIGDAIAAIQTPTIEVHISNVFAREAYRHQSFLSKNCIGSIIGLGLGGYRLAVAYFLGERV